MSDRELVTLDAGQFATLEQRLNSVHAELQMIRERLGPVDKDKNLHQVLSHIERTLFDALVNKETSPLIAGFALVAEAFAKGSTLPPPQPKLKGRFTLILKNDQKDFGYDFDVSGITDAEGEEITDQAVLDAVVKEVSSDNEGVVSATPPDAGGAGTIHIGTSGSAMLSGKAWLNQADKDAGKDPAFLAQEPFTITTGDPAAITEGSFKFDIESGGTPPVEG